MNWRQGIEPYQRAPVSNEIVFGERMDRFQAGVLSGLNYPQAMVLAVKQQPVQNFVALESAVRNGDWKLKYKIEEKSEVMRKSLTVYAALFKKGLSWYEVKAFTLIIGFLKLAPEPNSTLGTLSEQGKGSCDAPKSILECIGDQCRLRGSRSNRKRPIAA